MADQVRTEPADFAEWSLSEVLAMQVTAQPTAPFLLAPAQDWTYAAVDQASDRFATALLAAGIGRGDPIAVATPNCAEWVVTWLAAAKIGCPIVALNVVYREREFEYMINQSGARALICVAQHKGFDFVAMLEGLRHELPTLREFIFVNGSGFDGSRSWDDLASTAPNAEALRMVAQKSKPSDPSVILYTSGTTGRPKGAILTQEGILAAAGAEVTHFGFTADDVTIGHLPFNHVGGLTCTLAAMLVAGGAVALISSFHPEVAVRTIVERRVSVFLGVPTMYAMMLSTAEFAVADTSSVRMCVVGGSNLEPALAHRIYDSFPDVRLANFYGLSETSGGCVMSAAADDVRTLAETVGVPVGSFRIRVVDETGAPVPDGEVGELQVAGRCLASGYWRLPDATAESFLPGGWLATGDLGAIRPDRHVVLHGRKKEMYVRGGYNVYPVEVENFLSEQPGVAMCAVIGVPHTVFGEVGRAYVIPHAGRKLDTADLLERCRMRLAEYKVPEQIEIVDHLPLTSTGKIQKSALRDTVVSMSADPQKP